MEPEYEVLSLDDPEKIKLLLLGRREINERGCWIYTGIITKQGYGRKTVGNRLYLVHRLSAWLWKNMPIESDLQSLHKCDTPACFNPDHLFIGDQSDNMLDMLTKGRGWTNKITPETVLEIRTNPDPRTSVVAKLYGLTPQTIRDIKKRRTWKNVA